MHFIQMLTSAVTGKRIIEIFRDVVGDGHKSKSNRTHEEQLNNGCVSVGRESTHVYNDCLLLVSRDGERFEKKICLAESYFFLKLVHFPFPSEKASVQYTELVIPRSLELLMLDLKIALGESKM